MTTSLPRRAFLAGAPVVAAASGLLDLGFPGSLLEDQEVAGAPEGFPRQDWRVVREMVGASHVRFERVVELVEARPALAKAVWDWGFGDWESAIGAASHVGSRDIAEYLIEHGARPTAFTFAMMGDANAVEALVAAQPGLQRTLGPHGITLLQHVRNRMRREGLSAREQDGLRETERFLLSLGDADVGEPARPITDEERARYLGAYRLGPGENEVVEVLVQENIDALAIDPMGAGPRRLSRVEEHGFAPAGAPAVRVRFDVVDGVARALTIHDPVPLVRAVREG